jgi:hypothetical protein
LLIHSTSFDLLAALENSMTTKMMMIVGLLLCTAGNADAASPAAVPTSSPVPAGASTPAAESESVEALRDRLLAALGGREAWARASGYHVQATHYLADQSAPFANRIWLDFKTPRVRIESDMAGGARQRAMDLSADPPVAWRLGADGQQALTPSEIEEDRAWWNGNIYRTFHRLAARDPAVTLERLEDGRLQVIEGGEPLLWVRVNLAGEPIAFAMGGADAANSTIFGPLRLYDGLRFPSFSVRDQGRWRAVIERFEVDPALPPGRFQP